MSGARALSSLAHGHIPPQSHSSIPPGAGSHTAAGSWSRTASRTRWCTAASAQSSTPLGTQWNTPKQQKLFRSLYYLTNKNLPAWARCGRPSHGKLCSEASTPLPTSPGTACRHSYPETGPSGVLETEFSFLSHFVNLNSNNTTSYLSRLL